MGLSFTLDGRLVRFVTVDGVEFGEGLAVLRAGLAAAAAAAPGGGWGLLFDVRRSSESRSADDLRDIAGVIAAHRAHLSGRATVVAADPLHYGMGRMFAVFMESLGLSCEVFTDPDEADAWIGGNPRPRAPSPLRGGG